MSAGRFGRYHGVSWGALAICLAAGVGAAAESPAVSVSIAAQDLGAALKIFAQQTRAQTLFASDIVQGLKTPGVTGTYPPQEALRRLLQGTGLSILPDGENGFILDVAPVNAGGDIRRGAAPITAVPAEDAPRVEEIVVTAQKRAQQLIDVPISITAHSRDTMDLQDVRSIDDLARLTPGLSTIATSSYGGKTISIRGINSNTGASTTGIYIDDTPVQTRNYLGVINNDYPLVFDLDRVEVLRGPQGTLFGSGSEGGTVRFITPEASLTKTSVYGRADVSVTDGGQPSGEVGLAVGTPLVEDKVGMRISLWQRHTGGYIDRVSPETGQTSATDTNSGNDMAARAAFKIAASEALTITPSVFYQRSNSDDLNLFWPTAGEYKSWYGISQPERDRFILPALTVDYDFENFSVKSITSYFNRLDNRVEDYAPLSISALTGGAEAHIAGVDFHEKSGTIIRQRNWSQELRLTSREDSGSAFSWVVGLFWQNGEQTYGQTEVDNIGTLLPVLFPGYDTASFYGRDQLPGNVSFLENLLYQTQERALFGEVGYQLTGRLKVTAGVRAARSRFSYTDHQDGPFVGAAALDYAGGEHETPVTPRFNVSYALDQGQIYATAAKGYRIGGANPQVPVTCAADLASLGLDKVPTTYKSDTVWSYEVGAKQRFLDQRLEVDGSLFWVNWSGIQGNIPLPNCGFGYNTNLGKATSRGFDLQVQATPVRDLHLTAAVGYTDATYQGTVLGAVSPDTGLPTVLARGGDDLGTPPWQISLSAEYSRPVFTASEAYLFAAYQYSSPYHRTGSVGVNGYNPYTRDGRALQTANLRAGIRTGEWDFSTHVDNLSNTHVPIYYYRAQAAGADAARAETLRPLTVGLTALYRY